MEAETRLQSSVERRLDKKLGCSCYEHAYVLPSKDFYRQLDSKWWLYYIQDTPLFKRIMNKIHELTKSMSSNL